MIKEGSIPQEYITILNEYIPSNKASKYVRQKQIKLQREIHIFVIMIADFNILPSEIDPGGIILKRT